MHPDAQPEPAGSTVVAEPLARVQAPEMQRPRWQRGATDGSPPAPRETHTPQGFEAAPLARAEQTSRHGASEEGADEPALNDFRAEMSMDLRPPPDFANGRTPRYGSMGAVRGRMENAPRARARGRVHGSTTRFER